MQIFIEGALVQDYRIGKSDSSGFTEVFVNGNSSRHMLPSHIVADNSTYKTISFTVNGCNYKVVR